MYIPYTIALRRRCRSFGKFNPTLRENIDLYLPKLEFSVHDIFDYSTLSTFEERLLSHAKNSKETENDLLLYGMSVCCHHGHYNNASILLGLVHPETSLHRGYKALIESVIFERKGNMDLSLETLHKAESEFLISGDVNGIVNGKVRGAGGVAVEECDF